MNDSFLDLPVFFTQYGEKCSYLKTKIEHMKIQKLFVREPQGWVCYYILCEALVSLIEGSIATDLLTRFGRYPSRTEDLFEKGTYIEIGSRPSIETSDSSIISNELQNTGLRIYRVEKSNLYAGVSEADALKHHDLMTSTVYGERFDSEHAFITAQNITPSLPIMSLVDFQSKGKQTLASLNMNKEDIKRWYPYFISKARVPTDTEVFQIVHGNTEHSRHGFFGAKHVIDGVPMTQTMFELIKEPYLRHSANVIIAFHDNSSAVFGGKAQFLKTMHPTGPSRFVFSEELLHLTLTAETHNFPTTVEPYQGALTGNGGMLRDLNTAGKGSHWGAIFSGYIVDEIHFSSGYRISGEYRVDEYPTTIATGIDKYLRAIDGVAHYGNCSGIPTLGGFTRSFSSIFNGRIRSNQKCVLFAGGIGTIRDCNVVKEIPHQGSSVIQIGGPAYNVGFGGGFASSDIQSADNTDRDFTAVQRGNPLMGNSLKRVMEALASMEVPIVLLAHDQGAVGPCNAVTEAIEKTGGVIDIRKITTGDPSMSAVQLWGAEYQERNTIVIPEHFVSLVQELCKREGCYCDVLGTADNSGEIKLIDSKNPSHPPVSLPLDILLTGLPQQTYVDTVPVVTQAEFHPDLSLPMKQLVEMTMQQVDAGHKGHVVYRKDRTVTGSTVQGQTLGPLDLPISDYGLRSIDFKGTFGQFTAIGEQSPMVMLDPKKGARMTIAEAYLNAAGLLYDNPEVIVNWMWPGKRPGQNSQIYRACKAASEALDILETPTVGGKDSMSMITKHNGEEIYSLDTMVVTLSGRVPNLQKRISALLQHPGSSMVGVINCSNGEWRLGGSALAQACGNIGSPSQCPDVDPSVLKRGIALLHELIEKGLITAVHDTVGDGLFITCAEMAMAACCGVELNFKQISKEHLIAKMFAKEANVIVEYLPESESIIGSLCDDYEIGFNRIGRTRAIQEFLVLAQDHSFRLSMQEVKHMYCMTNTELIKEKIAYHGGESGLAKEEAEVFTQLVYPLPYVLNFNPHIHTVSNDRTYKVAIIRDKGSNGEKEMAYLFSQAGFETVDVKMSDFLDEESLIDLADFVGMAWVGGFSSGDVLGAGTIWASKVKHNKKIFDQFKAFFERPNTFTLGVCNGCQALALLLDMYIPGLSKHGVRLERNKSHLFEARTSTVMIQKNPSILFKHMEGSVLGTVVSHGEGQFVFSDEETKSFFDHGLVPIRYVDYSHQVTEQYPLNPNGSVNGIAGITSPDGRVTLLMPHPEREVVLHTLQHKEGYPQNLSIGPWAQIAYNAMSWVQENS